VTIALRASAAAPLALSSVVDYLEPVARRDRLGPLVLSGFELAAAVARIQVVAAPSARTSSSKWPTPLELTHPSTHRRPTSASPDAEPPTRLRQRDSSPIARAARPRCAQSASTRSRRSGHRQDRKRSSRSATSCACRRSWLSVLDVGGGRGHTEGGAHRHCGSGPHRRQTPPGGGHRPVTTW
jgi:hypothetical protein